MLKHLVIILQIASVIAHPVEPETNSRKCLPMQWEASVTGITAMDVLGVAESLPVTMETATDYVNKKETFHQHLHYSDSHTADVTYYRDFNQVQINNVNFVIFTKRF